MFRKTISTILSFLIMNIGFMHPRLSCAQEKESYNIAVLDLIANGISETEAMSLSDNMRGKFAEIAVSEKFKNTTSISYTLVERSQMDKIFDEFDVQNTGCTDISCAIEFGKMLYYIIGGVILAGGIAAAVLSGGGSGDSFTGGGEGTALIDIIIDE